MNNKEFLEKLKENGLVVVVRGNSREQAMETIRACYKGGIKLIEVTFTVPNADELIRQVSNEYKNDLIVGAGTVLNVKTARLAIDAGAQFVVSPNLNLELIEFCKKENIAYSPGILTPTELSVALDNGSEVIKLFPGDIARPEGLKALKGPFPNANIMTTGGVSFDNMISWFKAGAIAVGAGSNLTMKAKTGDYIGVTEDAKMWVNRISEIKGDKK
jgi:2-dehydro-3-deoxyphosphogluconate aldolase/(4S)-4-hydroxy-2-oxoglutarate aldolase